MQHKHLEVSKQVLLTLPHVLCIDMATDVNLDMAIDIDVDMAEGV